MSSISPLEEEIRSRTRRVFRFALPYFNITLGTSKFEESFTATNKGLACRLIPNLSFYPMRKANPLGILTLTNSPGRQGKLSVSYPIHECSTYTWVIIFPLPVPSLFGFISWFPVFVYTSKSLIKRISFFFFISLTLLTFDTYPRRGLPRVRSLHF